MKIANRFLQTDYESEDRGYFSPLKTADLIVLQPLKNVKLHKRYFLWKSTLTTLAP